MLGEKRANSLFDTVQNIAPEMPQVEIEESSPETYTQPLNNPQKTLDFTQKSHNVFHQQNQFLDYCEVLRLVQEFMSANYSEIMLGDSNKENMKRYIAKFIQDEQIAVENMTLEQISDNIYTEMAEYGFLTKYIFSKDIEEIDINSWKDIEVQYSNGKTVKLDEKFDSPEHAINVIRRMLSVSGMIIDNAQPIVLGHLSKNIRIAALKTPIVDEDVGDDTLMEYVTEAYPIIVFCKQLENKKRRLMEILECEILDDGTRKYQTLFQYIITENSFENGVLTINGHHKKVNGISEILSKRLLENGMPMAEIEKLRKV